MPKSQTISIITPCYNEEPNLSTLYTTLCEVVDKLDYNFEFLFVNDGSKDQTVNILRSLKSKDSRVKIVDLSRNFGKEIALSAGIDHCTGDAAIPLDADMQDPPQVIAQLIKKWEEGYEVVYAKRKTRSDGFIKDSTAYLFYRFINRLIRFEIPRDTGDFRLMNRQVINTIKAMPERNRFMKGIFAWVGFKQTFIEYERAKRNQGKTKINFSSLINLAVEGITSFSTIPLRISTYVGSFVSVFSIVYAFYLVGRSAVRGTDVPGYASIIVAVLLLGGLQLLSLGIIGEYIGKIYNETKQRPLYVVRSFE